MPLLRLAYAALFAVALIAVFTLWPQVGGQGHLDLIPWYWKLGLGAATAFAFVRAAAAAVAGESAWNARTLRWCGICLALMIGCGAATYYAHLYLEEETDGDEETNYTSLALDPRIVEVYETSGVRGPRDLRVGTELRRLRGARRDH